MLVSRDELLAGLEEKAAKIEEHLRQTLLSERPTDLIPLLTLLYFHEMRQDPTQPQALGRDRLVMASADPLPQALPVLAQAGYFPWEKIKVVEQRILERHGPRFALLQVPGVEMVCASSVVATTLAAGLAITGQTARLDYQVFLLLDAELTEPLKEALLSISVHCLDNITAVVYGPAQATRDSLMHEWFRLGWQPESIEISSMPSLMEGFAHISRIREKPGVMIGTTMVGA